MCIRDSLWTIILVIFIRHFVKGQSRVMRLRGVDEQAPAGFVDNSEEPELTYEAVRSAFDRVPPVAEPPVGAPLS